VDRQYRSSLVEQDKGCEVLMTDKMTDMPDEFFDWLDQCPVQWYRNRVDEGIVGYTFVIPDSEDEDEN